MEVQGNRSAQGANPRIQTRACPSEKIQCSEKISCSSKEEKIFAYWPLPFPEAARQGLRSALRTWAAARPVVARGFAAEVENHQEAVVPEKFKEDWKKIAPDYDLPHFPSSYMAKRPPVPDTLPTKLNVNFVLPHAFEMPAKQVDMVIVPATSGQMRVLPGHVPTIAELKPGLMSVHKGSEVKQYFVSSGFKFVQANSVADIVAIKAVPLDGLDPEEVRKGVQEYTQKMTSAKDDLERAEAEIGLEVHSALVAVLGVSA